MITDRFKTSKEIWNLTYEGVIKVMQEELKMPGRNMKGLVGGEI